MRRIRFIALVGTFLAASCSPVPPGDADAPQIFMRPQRDWGWYSMPWPNDIRRSATQMLDWTEVPGLATDVFAEPLPRVPVLPYITEVAQRSVSAFGRNTATYLQVSTAIDQSSLPTPDDSTSRDASVVLVDLATGERAPAKVVAQERADRYRPPHLLTVLPYPGHPLHNNARYAVVVFDDVRTTAGAPLTKAPLLGLLDAPYSAAGAATSAMTAAQHGVLSEQWAAVRSVVESSTNHVVDDVVAFTVFTTQDTDRDLQAVAAGLRALPVRPLTLNHVPACSQDPHSSVPSRIISGTVDVPQWQRGEFPYLASGGEIVLDGTGTAIPQGWTSLPFQVMLPCVAPPAGGWPVATYVDGTGATEVIGQPLIDPAPFVYGQIPSLYGDGVGSAGTFLSLLGYTGAQTQAGFVFYNLLNAAAGRTNPIQQASNQVAFSRALSATTFQGLDFGQLDPVRVNGDRVLAIGHSQGAQTLPLVAALAPEVDGVLSSSGSGGQYHSLAHTYQRRDILGQVVTDPSRLDELNPIVQLTETALEGSDGINFPVGVHMINFSGRQDDCVAVETARHFASAQRLPTVGSLFPSTFYGPSLFDPPTASLPLDGNVDGLTRANFETAGGHFTAGSNPALTNAFAAGIATGQTPHLPEVPLVENFGNCDGQRWDWPPTLFGF